MTKLKLLVTIFLMALISLGNAANFALEWDHDSLPSEEISFVLERKDQVLGTWHQVLVIPVGVKTGELNNVAAGTHTYRVIAVSTEGLKSEPSNELTVRVPTAARNLKFKIR